MRMMRKTIWLVLALLLLLSACGQKPAGGSGSAYNPTEASRQGSAAVQPQKVSVPIETVETDGIQMDYIKFGQGEKTLVILPGLSVQSVLGSAEQIVQAFEVMTGDFTIYLFDRRKNLPSSYSVEEMSEDTAKVVEALGLKDICMFGASMGGMMAMMIAADHPDLVEKTVLASTAAVISDDQFQTIDEWIRLAKEGDAEGLYLAFGKALYTEETFEKSRELLIQASKSVTQEDLDRFVLQAETMRGLNISDRVRKIQCPVFLVGDTDDHVLGIQATEDISSLLKDHPGFEMYVYSGYGHAVYDTAPDFKERMTTFFLSAQN